MKATLRILARLAAWTCFFCKSEQSGERCANCNI